MYASYEIKNDPVFIEFISNKELADSTKRIYAYRLKDFSVFLDKSPSDILYDSESCRIEENLYRFIENMREEGKSEITIQNNLDTIRTFYNSYNMNLPPNSYFIGENEVEDRILNKSHVEYALSIINKRDKAIILLQYTSGIYPQLLRNLKYEDFIMAMDNHLDIDEENLMNIKAVVNDLYRKHDLTGKWKFTKKSGEIYYTFNTTESSRAILDYLMHRERTGKPLQNLSDPLFVNQDNMKLKKSTYDGIFTRINKKADFKLLDTNKRFFTSFNLRKSFRKALMDSGMDRLMIDAIFGYKSIIQWDPEDVENLLINYKRASKFLVMDEYNDLERLKSKLNKNDMELKEIKKQVELLNYMVTIEKNNSQEYTI
jgi:site-specific recombinase XerD